MKAIKKKGASKGAPPQEKKAVSGKVEGCSASLVRKCSEYYYNNMVDRIFLGSVGRVGSFDPAIGLVVTWMLVFPQYSIKHH